MAELVEDCSLLSPPLLPQLAAGEGWALVRAPPLPSQLAAGEGWALVGGLGGPEISSEIQFLKDLVAVRRLPALL